VVLGLLAASVVAIALRPAVLGLDLQGGVEVVLQGQPTDESAVTPEAIDRSVEIIRSRVDAFGVSEPEIQTQGDDQIVVALPGADNPNQVVADLIQPAQLVFINFERNVVNADQTGLTDLYEAVQLARATELRGTRGKATFYAFKDKKAIDGVPPAADRATLRESFPGNVIPGDVEVLKVPKGLFLAFSEEPVLQTRNAGLRKLWYVFLNSPGIVGADVSSARATLEATGIGPREWTVSLDFTGEGGRKFADITRQLAQDGRIRGELQRFAIILDGRIVSNPTIDYNENPNGISGGRAQITGTFSQSEAQTLAKQINSGALPIELTVISKKSVSATLGKQSLRQGLVAGLVGLGLVMLFLIAYYRFLGIIAALALIAYAILLYAVVVLVPITLTLPGIAGIILTIGVAADANVVIFERVREEARSGKTPRASILAGYKKGITAIIDANVVTLATAAILFLFATAGVKGFAFTLFIGVLLSLFTAVVATRAAFNVLAETRFLRDDRFLGLNQREIRWKLDFVGKWKLWMAISFVPLVVGAIWIGVNGLNLGLDFESGTRITTSFAQQPSEDGVRRVFTDLGYDNAKIQSFSEVVDGKEVRGFQMQTETLQPAQEIQLQRALDAEFSINTDTLQTETVGPTFGKQVIRNAIYAILLSFIVIIIYLSIRFEYKLAIPALISVIHDVWLSIAIYSFTGREVTSATVAALLTILGYSLYDVVIVFDRIRENVPIMRKSTYRQVVNTSVHETLTRSIITSLITLIPLLVLFFFGGDTLKDFAFALLVGILSGGLSSIAIAAPIAALWKEREPENKRRSVKAERKAAMIASDSDVVDLSTLARAEAALDADLALEEGREVEAPPEEKLPRELGAGDDAGEPDEDESDDGGGEPVAATDPDPEPAPPSDAGASDDAPSEPAERTPRARPDPERVRRHRNVQKRRR
jgi:SecD/SecF fusion protein